MLTLRELKYLVRDALFEGVEQDRQELIKLYPDQKGDISRLGPKWIMWLMARFGPSAKLEETHPFEDALATVKSYSQRDAAISQKYNSSEQWRQAVDQAFPNRKWKNPADVMTMTSDDMETLLAMSQRKKQNVDVNHASNVENDRIGKVGPWNLWMPTTRENSCQIAGYNPATMKPYTTWCTARTSGSNLFYNYVGKENVILFYLIKDDAKSSSDRLSVGFVNGKPLLKGQNGGVSVDGNNSGLNEKKLASLLGSHYDQIMATLQDVADKNKGNHPAQKKIEEAGQSLVALKSMIKGLSKIEQDNLLEMIAEYAILSSEVAQFLSKHHNDDVRQSVTFNKNATPEVLMHLVQDKQFYIRRCIAQHRNVSVENLTQLAYDQNENVLSAVAENSKTTAKILTQLANNEKGSVRDRVALHANTPAEILAQLANDQDNYVRRRVAQNPNTPVKVLQRLVQDQNRDVRSSVAQNINAPFELLLQLAHDKTSDDVRRFVAAQKHMPAEILTLLAHDDDVIVREYVALNPNAPVKALQQLAQDKDHYVQGSAKNTLAKRLKENKVYERVLKRLLHCV